MCGGSEHFTHDITESLAHWAHRGSELHERVIEILTLHLGDDCVVLIDLHDQIGDWPSRYAA